MAELKLQKSASEKMLIWQYKALVGELLLLQQHSTDEACPCELTTEHEMCIPKHLLAIEKLAVETASMTDDANAKTILSNIAGAADDLSRAYQEAPEDKRPYNDIAQFAVMLGRNWSRFCGGIRANWPRLFSAMYARGAGVS